MKIYTYTIENFSEKQLITEIRFHIASARATSCDLVCLKTKNDIAEDGKEALSVIKKLRSLKKEGKIDFFADRLSFENGSAEAGYLINKFPDAVDLVKSSGFLFIVKL